jgi:hypothetical protein
MTFGMISIAETTTDIITLDTPIEELNGLTLNDFFNDSAQFKYDYTSSIDRLNFANDTTGTQNFNYNESIAIYTNINTPSFYGYTSQFLENSNVYYLSFKIKTLQNLTSISAGFNSGTRKTISNPNINEYLYYNVKGSPVTRRLDWLISGSQVNDIIHIDSVIIYNLTSLLLTSLTQQQLDDYFDIYINGGYYEYDAVLNELDMTDFIIISSSFVLWLWFMRFVKGVL